MVLRAAFLFVCLALFSTTAATQGPPVLVSPEVPPGSWRPALPPTSPAPPAPAGPEPALPPAEVLDGDRESLPE